MCLSAERLRSIYEKLGDATSKRIFEHRLLFSLLGKGLDAMHLEGCPEYAMLRSGKVCFYGAGTGCKALVNSGLRASFLIDTFRRGSYLNMPVISPDDFFAMPDFREFCVVVTVGAERAKAEIAALLSAHGARFLLAYPGVQYFDLPELALENEYFVDAGALDGQTTKYLLEHFKNGYAYVFEPNPRQFAITKENLGEGAELFAYGVSDENATVRFDTRPDDAGGASISADGGDVEIEVRRLDDLLCGRPVTFIKMDIEGAELAALRGAERIIREQKPKLAISIYHKPEDVWEIPELVLQYHPNYRLYLRHYTIINTETVLYAIP